MRRVSLKAILLLFFASCIFGVLTYASVKVSGKRNAFEQAFTDLKNIFGSRPSERHSTITAPLRSSKGVNFQKLAIEGSIGPGTVYAPESQRGKANSSSVVTTHPADLSIGMTEDDIYTIKGATAPFHSSSNKPSATAKPGRPPLGFDGTGATPLAGPIAYPASTAGPGSAGSNVNPGNCCVPCVKPAPESSWIVLVGTAFAFSVIGWSARTMRTRLSHRRRTHF